MPKPNDYDLAKAAYCVADLIKVTSLGRTTIFALVKAGDLRATKCGRRTLFLASDVAQFLANLQEANGR